MRVTQYKAQRVLGRLGFILGDNCLSVSFGDNSRNSEVFKVTVKRLLSWLVGRLRVNTAALVVVFCLERGGVGSHSAVDIWGYVFFHELL